MALDVVIWEVPGLQRSATVCRAMLEGIANCGDKVAVKSALSYREPIGDVGVFYGLAHGLAKAIHEYPALHKKAVYIDLGYWGRKDGGRFVGYHKFAVNGRHPTAYFQKVKHGPDRAAVFGLRAEGWNRSGRHILLAGMGPKGAAAEGYAPLEWEARAIRAIRRVSDRPVIYRPKPNWEASPPVPGATTARNGAPLRAHLAGAHCIVAHHSNAAIEALAMGYPAFVADGAAMPMALSDLSAIDTPIYPDGREQWLADLAYTQFNVAEMAAGVPWRHLKSEGLL